MPSAKQHIFVTGGLGFIGSHTSLNLLDEGYEVTLFDNMDNSYPSVLERMKALAGDKAKHLHFIKGDVRNAADLDQAFGTNKFNAVIHFAARKAVGESVAEPWLYYTHNLVGSVNLMEAMRKHNVKNMVFSSSCTVYGEPTKVPIDESHRRQACSPYGNTKLVIEDIMQDYAKADPEWKVVLLRYFNPIGAHPSGDIGEHPKGEPQNLLPYVQQVTLKQRECLSVYGNDYPTRDGTCIRDYIHVVDLAEGHVAALRKLDEPGFRCKPYNLGTGTGTTVLEMIAAFEKASGKKCNYKIVGRRAGDSSAVYALTDVAERELGWKAKLNVDDMCRDQWAWASKNPNGFEE